MTGDDPHERTTTPPRDAAGRAGDDPPTRPPGDEPEAGDQSPPDPDAPTDAVREGNTLVEPAPGD